MWNGSKRNGVGGVLLRRTRKVPARPETHCGTRHAVPKGTHAVVRMLCFVGSGADAGQMSEQKREEMKQRKEAEANEKQRQEDAR